MRVALYCRVSTDEQTQGRTIFEVYERRMACIQSSDCWPKGDYGQLQVWISRIWKILMISAIFYRHLRHKG